MKSVSSFSTGLLIALFSIACLFGKRGPGPEVAPVHFEGTVYTVTAEPDRMGVVEAFDEASKKKLWEKKIYSVSISPGMETDVQWVFINSMQLKGNALLISNERGEWFALDLTTKAVREISKSSH
ncbi:MAG TPA: hypothetical protein VNB29_11775 [Chthoniobacterales bacterium]|nr:hypothetical protein [Chthoniobacterales bacterium]